MSFSIYKVMPTQVRQKKTKAMQQLGSLGFSTQFVNAILLPPLCAVHNKK